MIGQADMEITQNVSPSAEFKWMMVYSHLCTRTCQSGTLTPCYSVAMAVYMRLTHINTEVCMHHSNH